MRSDVDIKDQNYDHQDIKQKKSNKVAGCFGLNKKKGSIKQESQATEAGKSKLAGEPGTNDSLPQ